MIGQLILILIVRDGLEKCDYARFFNYIKHPSAVLAHPTNDHYLPLLYLSVPLKMKNPNFLMKKLSIGQSQ